MDIQASTAVVPWAGALTRTPAATPRGFAGEHRARSDPPVLEGELLAADGRSDAERALHADWVQRRRPASARAVSTALATYAGVADAARRPTRLLDLYAWAALLSALAAPPRSRGSARVPALGPCAQVALAR